MRSTILDPPTDNIADLPIAQIQAEADVLYNKIIAKLNELKLNIPYLRSGISAEETLKQITKLETKAKEELDVIIENKSRDTTNKSLRMLRFQLRSCKDYEKLILDPKKVTIETEEQAGLPERNPNISVNLKSTADITQALATSPEVKAEAQPEATAVGQAINSIKAIVWQASTYIPGFYRPLLENTQSAVQLIENTVQQKKNALP